ncbi:hypothetical protein PN36_09450 [Candidatus Thiomargarita nelsonii]|uniref:Secreted protein n=1 Tax=Candidatus Thiomargarita nelsonii TaxID=1003181 RepID=A0A0A6P3P7_9GAMM|nr:hypothetical protein PN36_09450 [Candidatus Thiomargarita nelsonii]
MNYLKLWASLVIFFLLSLSGKAFADLTDLGEIVADLSEPLVTTVPSTINKASVVDNGDYYILNTGKKASFLRLENTYLLVSDSKITSPAAL